MNVPLVSLNTVNGWTQYLRLLFKTNRFYTRNAKIARFFRSASIVLVEATLTAPLQNRYLFNPVCTEFRGPASRPPRDRASNSRQCASTLIALLALALLQSLQQHAIPLTQYPAIIAQR